MVTPHEDQLRHAVELARAGDKDQAISIVAGILQQDQNNGAAWVLMAQLITDESRRRECLGRAVTAAQADPTDANQKASKWALQQLYPSANTEQPVKPTQTPAEGMQTPATQKRKIPTSVIIVVGLIITVCVVCVGIYTIGSSTGATSTVQSTNTPCPTHEPDDLIVTDPAKTGIAQQFLTDLMPDMSCYGNITSYEAEVNKEGRLLVSVDTTLTIQTDRATGMRALEASLRRFAAMDKSHTGELFSAVRWGVNGRCGVNAGMGYAVMQTIDWQHISQSDLFAKLNQGVYNDSAAERSNYPTTAFVNLDFGRALFEECAN